MPKNINDYIWKPMIKKIKNVLTGRIYIVKIYK